MPFSAMGYMLTNALTRDLPDRAQAANLSLIGGMFGNNLPAVVMLASVAGRRRSPGTVDLPPGGAPTPAPLPQVPGSTTPTGTTPTGTTPAPTPTAPPLLVQIPRVEADSLEEAEARIRSRGLVPATASVESGEPVDHVIGTDPPEESVVARGSSVSILVSAGIEVPRVVGLKVDDADEILKAAGFETERRATEHAGRAGVVDRQEPEAGSFTDPGTVVTIFVFEAKKRGGLRSTRADHDDELN